MLTATSKILEQAGQTATTQEHQRALYCLLCELDRICKKLHIPYFLFAGTLIGAVRNNGFIPWDDDLDVLMLRKDYDRFLAEAPAVLNQDRFFLQGEFSEHFPMFFSKLRLNGTTCLEKYRPKDPLVHQGVYLDIFPCDNAFDSKIGRRFQFFSSKIVIAKGLDAEGYVTNSKLKKAVMAISRLLPQKPFLRIVKGPKASGKYVHTFLGAASKYSKNVYPSVCFQQTVLLKFEDALFPVPGEFDKLLTIIYGDYRRIPSPEERQRKQHAILVDLTKSYEAYEHYRDGMEFDVLTRSIR